MSLTAKYAGDVSAERAFEVIEGEPDAVLVDVRTQPEWSDVGVPDLSALGKQPIFLEWQLFPSMAVDAEFARKLADALTARGTPTNAPVLFLCRSGARSLAAAKALAALGYSCCLNVAGGFEGPPDAAQRRGQLDGWKAKGLPWVQA